MSPMKVMPLLLTGITPFVMVSGTARAAEPQIILAQAQTPQQLEEERKKKLQQQHEQGHQQPQQRERGNDGNKRPVKFVARQEAAHPVTNASTHRAKSRE